MNWFSKHKKDKQQDRSAPAIVEFMIQEDFEPFIHKNVEVVYNKIQPHLYRKGWLAEVLPTQELLIFSVETTINSPYFGSEIGYYIPLRDVVSIKDLDKKVN